jgi:hypothetical protein
MRYIPVTLVGVILITACHRKAEVTGSAPEASVSVSNGVPEAPAFAAWGATKEEIIAKLEKMKAKIITNTPDLIVAEADPAGFTSSDGKPITHPLRTEYYFKDGKLAQSRLIP